MSQNILKLPTTVHMYILTYDTNDPFVLKNEEDAEYISGIITAISKVHDVVTIDFKRIKKVYKSFLKKFEQEIKDDIGIAEFSRRIKIINTDYTYIE